MSRHAFWIAAVVFGALVLAKFDSKSGFTSLLRFGGKWQDHRLGILQDLPIATVPDSSGYDGQFYAQIALDPLLRNPELARVLDLPAYRARRILAPATAAALGLGNAWWTLQAYALLNVFCWFALGWLLRQHVGGIDWQSFARWVGCMFSMGVLDSVRQSLVDLPALLLLGLAVRTCTQNRNTRSTLWLTLANLAKESSLIGTVALLCDKSWRLFSWKRALGVFAAAALPLGIWSFYVSQCFPSLSDSIGLGNFNWPMLGLLTQVKLSLRELSLGNFDSRYGLSLLAIGGLLVQFGMLWRVPQPQSAWWRIGAAYSLLLFLLSFWVWSGYWAACRAVLPMTIAFNLLLPAKRSFWPLWIIGNISLLHAVWRFL